MNENAPATFQRGRSDPISAASRSSASSSLVQISNESEAALFTIARIFQCFFSRLAFRYCDRRRRKFTAFPT